jgi:hypothetical protein
MNGSVTLSRAKGSFTSRPAGDSDSVVDSKEDAQM